MNSKELEEYLNKHYPFKAETDNISKYENMLMSIRRTAFIDGAEFIINNLNKVL